MSVVRYRYQTIEFDDIDIHVKTLRDKQQFNDPQGIAKRLGISSAAWPIFGVIWESGRVLAEIMSILDITKKRILEVGCGIGLASLILNHRKANITATDIHPDVNELLSSNARLNGDKYIPFVRMGWSDESKIIGEYDLIIGSDLLYEPEQASLLANFIDQHAKPLCEIIIVDPGRGYRGRFKKHMKNLGYSYNFYPNTTRNVHIKNYTGQILRFRKA